MDHTGLVVVLLVLFLGAILFFSVNIISLRTFSLTKLLEAFGHVKQADIKARVDRLVDNTERLTLTCSWYLVLFRAGTLLLLILFFAGFVPAHPVLGYIYAFITVAVLFSIVGMAIPHAWAKYAGEKVLSRSVALLSVLSVGAVPVLFVQRWYDGLVRRLAGVTEGMPEEERHEEFLTELQQHRREGAVDEEEQTMIENVLELSDSTADEIMTPRTDLVAVEVHSDLPTVLQTITRAGHSRVPVYEGTIDNIAGFVYAKDLLKEIGQDPRAFQLRERLRQAFFVPENKPLRALLHEFQSQKLHVAVVLDEYGGTAGIVTMEDILEELVGEITDEYEKVPPATMQRIDEHTVELDARAYVDDINDRFALALPEDEDYETIGGFVFSRLGYIPRSGETFDYENLRVEILSAGARRIHRIRIRRLPGPASTQET